MAGHIHHSRPASLDCTSRTQRNPCNRRDNVAELEENCRRRNSSGNPQLVAKLYTEYVAMEQKVDGVRKERNDNAASMKVRHKCTTEWEGVEAFSWLVLTQ